MDFREAVPPTLVEAQPDKHCRAGDELRWVRIQHPVKGCWDRARWARMEAEDALSFILCERDQLSTHHD